MKTEARLVTPEIAAKLRAGVARAESAPASLAMYTWAEHSSEPCGVRGCLAFEITASYSRLTPMTLLARHYRAAKSGDRQWLPRYAAKIVGLSFQLLWDTLFNDMNWPPRFRARYDRATKATTRVRILKAVVEDFIKEDGQW